MIIKAPSPNIMNKLARSVLALYSYDELAEDMSLENIVRQSIELIGARFDNYGQCLSGKKALLRS